MHHLHGFELFEPCLLGNFIVTAVRVMFEMTDIGDVAYVTHVISEVFQITKQNVEGDGRPRVAKVRITVYRGAADIHAHVRRVKRFEYFFLP